LSMQKGLSAKGLSCDVAVCLYEDSVETVKRLIEGLKDHVRNIIVVDGKFEFFQSDQDLSSEAVREYLRSISNVILLDYPNRKENEKRQVYLDKCKELNTDFLLILDGDCHITTQTNWTEFYRDLDRLERGVNPQIYCIGVRTPMKTSYFPLLWYLPYKFEYMKTHNFWRRLTDGAIIKSTNNGTRSNSLRIKQDDKLRTTEYVKKSMAYQAKLIAYEKPLRIEYRKVAINTSPAHNWDTFYGIPMV